MGVSISYAITAVNEHVELERLLDILHENISYQDEIVLQLDTTATPEVKKVAEKYNVGTPYEYHRITFALNKDFATFKNNLANHCTRDVIVNIDADEYIDHWFIQNIHYIIEHNPEIDVFLMPRINTVEGLTEEHIIKWGWRVEHGRVNYPDLQTRIWRNNKGIKWINKVHERLDGFDIYTTLPELDELSLFHPKTIERQEKQNQFYNTI
jgi:hypothetical protein